MVARISLTVVGYGGIYNHPINSYMWKMPMLSKHVKQF